jgi:hypothetical protein
MESERTVGGRRSPTVVIGPLADYAAGFRQFLIAQGYVRRTITVQVSLMAHLSRWLQAEGLTVDALRSSADIDRFFCGAAGEGTFLGGVGKRVGRPAWFPARPSGHRRAGGGRGNAGRAAAGELPQVSAGGAGSRGSDGTRLQRVRGHVPADTAR